MPVAAKAVAVVLADEAFAAVAGQDYSCLLEVNLDETASSMTSYLAGSDTVEEATWLDSP